MKGERKHTSGITGSIIFHAILLILLYFFGFKSLIPESEEGIMINFGDGPTGTGQVEPKPSPVAQTTPPPPPTPVSKPQTSTPSASDAEKLNTQDFEESVAMKSAEEQRKKEEEKKRQEAEAEKKRQEELAENKRQEAIEAEKQRKLEEEERIRKEQERIEQERLEKERLEREAKERQAKEISNRTANVFAAAGKSNGNSTSEGDAGGSGNQGSLNGDPNSKSRTGSGLGNSGNSYSLAGRSLVGSLPTPVYNIQEEGVVVVQVEVDQNGKVISATPIVRGSTTQNPQLWQEAKAAALKARFSSNAAAASKQVGTITYIFQLD